MSSRLKIVCCAVAFLFFLSQLRAQESRIVRGLNEGWKFHLGGQEYADDPAFNDAAWTQTSLPHTWNAHDPFDDDETYYRGIGWYRRELVLEPELRDKQLFLYFEGANQVTDVYLNGAFVGQHKGGYTPFTIDLNTYIDRKPGARNVIAIQVNNAHDNEIIPLSVGYALYGGIYRSVWLIATAPVHFSEVNKDAGGIYVSTPNVTSASAQFNTEAWITNESPNPRKLVWENSLFDRAGRTVITSTQEVSLQRGERKSLLMATQQISNPHLWSPEDPYLYHLRSRLKDGDQVVDEVTNTVGFRWFRFDADSGFFLNGKQYPLRGTNRHQDFKGKGSALTGQDHERDLKIIKEMGANFLRLAHYPQAPEVLNLADRLGLIIWEEVPLVNYMNVDESFLQNTMHTIKEMIHAHYNHPSIVMWGSMNEILLHSKAGDRIQRHTDTAYLSAVRQYSLRLDSLIRTEDPYRYTTLAMHGSNDYATFGLDTISQVDGHNLYNGWYSGRVEEFGPLLDRMHKQKPAQVIFISEYGAGSDQRLNTSQPQRLDFTGQYQRYFHESYLRQIKARPYLAGTAIWNEFDFSQPNIGGPMSNENNKGMLTWDRKYKDVYYLYKANWNPEPMVYIASRDWTSRGGKASEHFSIDIYSNAPKVSLFVNGKPAGTQTTNDLRKASFDITLREGDNFIEAQATVNGQTLKDAMVLQYKTYPESFTQENFRSIYINVGSQAQYTDASGTVWLQDQPYRKGSYGYLSGKPSTLNLKYLIKGTNHTPLFYSYLDSIQAYRVDVPEGRYELSLSFIENEKTPPGAGIFDVSVNGQKLTSQLDLASEYGFCQAVTKTYVVTVSDNKGLEIQLDASRGRAVLSGVSVIKQ